MDYKTYRKETFTRVNQFDIVFKPWKKWQDIKLIDVCPCKTCEVNAEYINRRYEIMMSEGVDEDLVESCRHCMERVQWLMECVEKLSWYEDNDERLKHKE